MHPATSAPTVEIRFLGPFELLLDGEAVNVPGRRERAVLALLASTPGDAVGVDRLMAFLWAQNPPRTADKTLQTYVSRLRGILGEERLDRRGAGYVLRVTRDEVDATRFEDLLAAARAAQRTGDAATAADCLDKATDLWRGDEPAVVPDTPEATIWRRALLTARAEAEEALFAHMVAAGRADEALPELERRTVAEPLRERPWALLMEALARSGRPADALDAFRRARDHYADELGLDPPPSLRAMEQRIIAQDPSLSPTASGPAPSVRAGAAPAMPLPVSDARLVGRDDDRVRVEEALAGGRLVTIVGPGGVGKTSLALDVATSASTRAALCELAAVREPAAAGHALATAVGVEASPGDDPVLAAANAVGDDPLLLVVDNCEHLTEEVRPLLYRLLTAASGLTVLATSREPLRIGEERVVPLAPLAVDSGHAATMFLERVARSGAELPDDDATQDLVHQVCHRLDGLPLAIELAAGTVRVVGLRDLLADLDDRAALLERTHVLAGRERGLRASAQWSYDLLDAPLQTLLRRSSVFVGGLTPAAAAAVCAGDDLEVRDVPAMLAELGDRSLLQRTGDHTATRYRMLETLRTAAAELLDDDERGAISRAHATWAVALAEELGHTQVSAESAAASRRFDLELANLRVAMRWSFDTDDVDLALRMVRAAYWPTFLGLRTELFGWAYEAVERFGDHDHPLVPDVLACAATWRGLSGDQGAAVPMFARLEAWDAQGRAIGPLARSTMVAISARLGDLDAARRHLAALRADEPDEVLLLTTEGDLAAMEGFVGDHEAARRRFTAIRPRLEGSEATLLRSFAETGAAQLVGDDDPETALAHLQRAIELARTTGTRMPERTARSAAASLAGRATATTAALTVFDDILGAWQRDGVWRMEWGTLQSLMELLARLGRHEELVRLHAAMEASDTAPPLYGDQEERIVAAVAAAEEALGADATRVARADGSRLTDGEAVAHARAFVADELAADAPT